MILIRAGGADSRDALEGPLGPVAARPGEAEPGPDVAALAVAWALLAFAGPALGGLLAGRVVAALGPAGALGLADAAAAGLFASLAVLGPAAPALPRLAVAGGRHGSASLVGAAGLAALLGALAAGVLAIARAEPSPQAGAAAIAVGGSVAAAAVLAPAVAALGARGRATALLAAGTALGIGVAAAVFASRARLSPALAATLARSGVAAGAALAATGLAALALRRLPPCGEVERDEALFSLRRHLAAGLASAVPGAAIAAAIAWPPTVEARALAVFLALPAPIYALVAVRRPLAAGPERPLPALRRPPRLAGLVAIQALCGAAAVGLAGTADRRLAALGGAAAAAIALLLPAVLGHLGLDGHGSPARGRRPSGGEGGAAGEPALAGPTED